MKIANITSRLFVRPPIHYPHNHYPRDCRMRMTEQTKLSCGIPISRPHLCCREKSISATTTNAITVDKIARGPLSRNGRAPPPPPAVAAAEANRKIEENLFVNIPSSLSQIHISLHGSVHNKRDLGWVVEENSRLFIHGIVHYICHSSSATSKFAQNI